MYVEHDIDASESEAAVSEFIVKDKALQGAGLLPLCCRLLCRSGLQLLHGTCCAAYLPVLGA